MIENGELKNLIYSKFKNESEFAERLGWSRQKLNICMKKIERLRCEQAKEIIDALELTDTATIFRVFLNIKLKFMQ